jgi:hypothetical protein
MKFLIILIFLLDPFLLFGKWNLKFSEANFNLINSPAFDATPKNQQDEILEVNELYLKNAYFEFKNDTVFWTDVNAREKKVVYKKGKWNLDGDTLNIYDYDIIYSYKFLVSVKEDELNLRMIFPNGVLARSKITFEKEY